MVEILKELQEKRDKLNIEARSQRRERDFLNQEARGWIRERDKCNAELRENLDKANSMKKLREEYNQAVKEYKQERRNWGKAVSRLSTSLNSFKRRLRSVDLVQLERQLKALEFRQQTSVMSIEDERELLKELSRIKERIKQGEAELMKNEEYRKVRDELIHARSELERHVKLVSDSAEKAQNAHEEMLKNYENCDVARAKGDEAQDNFLKVKAKADVFHNRYIEIVKEIHDMDRAIIGLMQKDKVAKIEKDEVTAKKEAEDIFERFKRGEKLSTEDLMTLQKSGYI